MPLSINSIEMSSLTFRQNINEVSSVVNKRLEQLSTGNLINSVKDDVAAYVQIANTDTLISSYTQAQQNAQNGINLTSIASGALESVQDDLELVREYAVKASSDLLSESQRTAYQELANTMADNIVNTLSSAEFNGKSIFNSDAATYTEVTDSNPTVEPSAIPTQSENEFRIQVGIDSADSSAVFIDTGVNYGDIVFNFSSTENASNAISYIDELSDLTINKLADIGTSESVLDSISQQQSDTIMNLNTTKSAINDLDYAEATFDLIKNQLLMETSILLMTDSMKMNSAMTLSLVSGSVANPSVLI